MRYQNMLRLAWKQISRAVAMGLLGATVIATVGCGGASSSTGSNGGRHRGMQVHTSQLNPRPATLMVARKISRPLYLVLDPSEVPDEFLAPRDVVKPIQILEIHEFVRRDLVAAMQTIFESVEVVSPAQVPDHAGSFVARVRIEQLGTVADVATVEGYTGGRVYGAMRWSFAIMAPGGVDFAFSYADNVTGDFAMTHTSEVARMMEAAYRVGLESLLRRLVEEGFLESALLASEPTSGDEE